MCCVKRLLTTLVVHQRWPRWLNQQLVFPCLHCLLFMDRQARSAPVMVLPRVRIPPMHHALWASTAKPGLRLHSIIHKVHDPVHLPPAPVPGPGVCQQPVLQAHQGHRNQDPMLDLMPAPEHIQPVAVLMCQFILALYPLKLYWCMVTMMKLPQLEKRMHLTRTTMKLCHKVLCHCLIFLPPMMKTLTRL